MPIENFLPEDEVPEAHNRFSSTLTDFENAIRLAVSLAVICSTLHLHHRRHLPRLFMARVPAEIQLQAYRVLGTTLADTTRRFMEQYPVG